MCVSIYSVSILGIIINGNSKTAQKTKQKEKISCNCTLFLVIAYLLSSINKKKNLFTKMNKKVV